MDTFHERGVLMVDGSNMYGCCRALGLEVDFGRLRTYIASLTNLQRAYYYTAILEGSEYTSLRPLVDWLAYNGYKVVKKNAKEYTTPDGGRRIKGNIDIELTVDAMVLSGCVDHYYICSGDGDFSYLVEELQRRGRKVTAISSRHCTPPMMSDGLRRSVDGFIDLMDIKEHIGRVRPES
jgi:uncharacterized LabA/DUF88 family protein